VAVDTTDGELETSLGRAGLALGSRRSGGFLLASSSSLASSHFAFEFLETREFLRKRIARPQRLFAAFCTSGWANFTAFA